MLSRKLTHNATHVTGDCLSNHINQRVASICIALLVLAGCDNPATKLAEAPSVNINNATPNSSADITIDEFSICNQSNSKDKKTGLTCDKYCIDARKGYLKRIQVSLRELESIIEKVPQDDQANLDSLEKMTRDKYGNIDSDNAERIFNIQYNNPYYTTWALRKAILETLVAIDKIERLSDRQGNYRDIIINRVDLSTGLFLKLHSIAGHANDYLEMDRNRTPAIIDKLDKEKASAITREYYWQQSLLASYINCNVGLLR